MTSLRDSLQRSLAFCVQRAQAAGSGVALSTISRPVPGGKSAIFLIVTVPDPWASGSYNVRTCPKAEVDAVRAEVLQMATAFVHSVGGVAL